jgi:hypothetical protein
MNRKPSHGLPALFHAAVVFAVFFSFLGTPISKGSLDLGGFGSIFARIQALLYTPVDDNLLDRGSTTSGGQKGGRKFGTFNGDGTYDPPPPPPPPPKP